MPRSLSSVVALLICATLLFNVECKSSEQTDVGFAAYASVEVGSKIKWRNWDEATFAEAQKNDKPVFLFLTQVWCAQCDEMETRALNTDNVAAQINQDYLPIKIDADRYPNLYDRYHFPGYPSCVVLTPDARVIGGGTYLPADSLTVLLTRISKYWKDNLHSDKIVHIATGLQIKAARMTFKALRIDKPYPKNRSASGLIIPVFLNWTPLEYAPSSSSPMLTARCATFKLAIIPR